MEAQVTRVRPLELVSAVLVGLWGIGLTWLNQLLTWLVEQFLIFSGVSMPPWRQRNVARITRIAFSQVSLLRSDDDQPRSTRFSSSAG
jgi:hypothetical protein